MQEASEAILSNYITHSHYLLDICTKVSWAPWEYVKDWHFKQLAFLNAIIAHSNIAKNIALFLKVNFIISY